MPPVRSQRLLAAIVAFAALLPPARAERPRDLRARVRAHREANELAILRELSELLAIPNVASDKANIRRNADRLVEMLGRRGVTARLLEADGSPPAVYGELRVPGAKRTVILYAHYDGQPVDPAAWKGGPFRPVLRDRRLEEGGKEIPFPTSGRTRPDWRL